MTLVNIEGVIPARLIQMAESVRWPTPRLKEEWDHGNYLSGSTEPWNVAVLAALMKALDARDILECGGYLGNTSAWLAMTLKEMGGGRFTIIELEADRAAACDAHLSGLPLSTVDWRVIQDDVFRALETIPNESLDFAWVDDCHEKAHVDRELAMLIPKMRSGGVITGHDVWGSCDLQEIFAKHGGYSLDTPRLGPAGGIGIIQIPR